MMLYPSGSRDMSQEDLLAFRLNCMPALPFLPPKLWSFLSPGNVSLCFADLPAQRDGKAELWHLGALDILLPGGPGLELFA